MDRRELLTLAVTGRKQAGRRRDPAPSPHQKISAGLEPYRPTTQQPWNRRRAAHLLRRARLGPPRRSEIDRFMKLGPAEAVAELFRFPPSPVLPAWADEPVELPLDFEAEYRMRQELVTWWLRQAYVDGSIRERLVFFWSNHFVVEMEKVFVARLILSINRLFRDAAAGDIRDLTKRVGQNPAMLIYLDGNLNTKYGINENYARELLELFTMGRSHYTQTDVTEAARALTGWRINPTLLGAYRHPLLHDNGQKTFLGHTGNWNDEDIVDIIFGQRATAVFLAGRIYRHFVSPVADEDLVQALADRLIASDFELEPVLKDLLGSAHFMADELIGSDIKSPIDFLLGVLRQFHATKIDWPFMGLILSVLGQTPFDPPNVAGWPGHRDWLSTSSLPFRQMLAQAVIYPSRLFIMDYHRFLHQLPHPEDPRQLVRHVTTDFLPLALDEQTEAELVAILLGSLPPNQWNPYRPEAMTRVRLFLQAVMQMAEYQLH
ncbi:MAG: DUF1800 domain-containing protein [Acidobacteria bacterium]|nr:DUF1800 domain-containing protein [Acidobacteriota bacterium]